MPTPFDPSRSRVFVTYGCTAEQYCLASGLTVPYEKFMHDHLRRNGFETVVFFSHRGCCFYDRDSRDAVFATNEAAARRQAKRPTRGGHLLLKHSTGLRVLEPAKPVGEVSREDGDRLRFPDMAKPSLMVPLIRRLFQHGDLPLAVVFSSDDIHAALLTSELTTQFRAFVIHDMSALPLARKAVMIFNVPGFDPWTRLQNHPWGFLLGESEESCDGAALPVFVGDPCTDEVERHLQTLHVHAAKRVDPATFPDNVNRLTAHIRALRQNRANRLGLEALAPLHEAAVIDRPAVDRLVGQPGEKPSRERLDDLVGLHAAKRYLHAKMAEAAHHRRGAAAPSRSQECGRLVPAPVPAWRKRLRLHVVFQGNPGTGKTTVARLMGDLYRDAGLLEVGHVVKVTRADLVGEYVGHTAPRVRTAVQRAIGGILFVDEAYDLCHDEKDVFGLEAVAALTEAMSDNDGQLAVVLAGYPDAMKRLLATNEGLERRFNEILTLDDYGPAELESILRRQLADAGARLDAELDAVLPRLCRAVHDTRDENFGNAGAMERLADTINRARIVENVDTAGIRHLPDAEARLLDRPATTADGVLAELDGLVGLASVKQRVRTIFNRLAIERRRGGDAPVVPGHMVFAGNPGTGKTTVARLMARQFHALGILPRSEVHETSAGQLIAGYVGQTSVRTREFLEKGVGHLIFIDEAHQLARGATAGHQNTFGRDVIDVLVPFAENHRQDCVIVLAGYTDAMDELVRADDGLARRFPQQLLFEDYSADELVTIFDVMVRQAGYIWPAEAGRERLLRHFAAIKAALGSRFGNAGAVRNVLGECLERHANRLSPVASTVDTVTLSQLAIEDLPDGR